MRRQVTQRKTLAEAEKLAKDIKGKLKRGEVGRVHRATADEKELLEMCRKLPDPRRMLEEALKADFSFSRFKNPNA